MAHCRETILEILRDGQQHTFFELLTAFQNAEQDQDLIHILISNSHNKPKVYRDLLSQTLIVMEREDIITVHDDGTDKSLPLFSIKFLGKEQVVQQGEDE